VKPETFSRVVRQLTQDGVISVQGAHIAILNRGALVELAELADTSELDARSGPLADEPLP
jgi:hypothetical protein